MIKQIPKTLILLVILAVNLNLNRVALTSDNHCENRAEILPRLSANSNATNSCNFDNSLSIEDPDFRFKSVYNSVVHELQFSQNQNVLYLPVGVAKTFPKLRIIFARSCSIKAVKKENFAKLEDLVIVNLGGNQIKTIQSDVFEESRSLIVLNLGE